MFVSPAPFVYVLTCIHILSIVKSEKRERIERFRSKCLIIETSPNDSATDTTPDSRAVCWHSFALRCRTEDSQQLIAPRRLRSLTYSRLVLQPPTPTRYTLHALTTPLQVLRPTTLPSPGTLIRRLLTWKRVRGTALPSVSGLREYIL